MLPDFDFLSSGIASDAAGASTQLIAAPGLGFRTFITDITIVNTSATPVTVNIQSGVGGATKWTMQVKAGDSSSFSFRNALGSIADNTAVAFQTSAAAATVTVSVNGFKKKVRTT